MVVFISEMDSMLLDENIYFIYFLIFPMKPLTQFINPTQTI